MEKGRLAILISSVVIVAASLVFLKWALMGREIERADYVEKTLRILSYSTFVSSTGPAPALVQEFKTRCKCKVEFVTAGDAGLLLERLKLTQEKAHFDLVIGLDQFWAGKAANDLEWMPIENHQELSGLLAEEIKTDQLQNFLPFDYAPMTFIFRKDEVQNPPTTLDDLLKPDFRSSLSLQDPRSSSPGLQFLSWVVRTKKDQSKNFLNNLKTSIHSVSPSWALSYGLFKKEQSKFVFSHVTSLAFHLAVENDQSYSAVSFLEGHPLHVEYAGVPKGCKNCDLGKEFISFMLEEKSQELISQQNFMLPARKGVPLPPAYQNLPSLKTLPLTTVMPDLKIWDQVFE